TSALVQQFKGSLSAEHGVGVARTEYMRDQLGDELLRVMREIKHAFDPKNIFNPGKIFEDGGHRIDNHLRENFTRPLEPPFQPVLAFAFKDRSFTGNLEQCNGCGGCLKHSGIMCPTFMATGEEVMSTRGRANIIRAALELRVNGHDPLKSAELDAALSNCLSCKGCTPECPSNVNLALLKAEMLYARWRRDGLPVRDHEPHIGIAAVKVLEALGFEVVLVRNRRCCGRPAFSQGNLDAAAKVGKHNVDLVNAPTPHVSPLGSHPSTPPILFLEPSCWSMFVEDYRELKIEGADNVANRCFLFENFVDDLLAKEPTILRFNER